ncbi:muts domain V-domain-containing protein [Epithele typhae]|uniref:muts domain V-domain-containing protein n=1 Tax=Epithele typhae TaxID=378194 RepID=UPI0020081ADE|nr:muts domain V-domain-containing protein [Epithele typhae]KAH9944535.1 muts domain V-domain-containing protein [Epithele typhae]
MLSFPSTSIACYTRRSTSLYFSRSIASSVAFTARSTKNYSVRPPRKVTTDEQNVSASELLDGVFTHSDESLNASESSNTPSFLENLRNYPHCILLTRVGQFYESYFDQAKEVAQLLNIKLAKKSWDGQRYCMAGFPIVQLNKYLKVLVQDHRRFVAICEEFPRDPALGAKGGFDRRVVRIVTPGTLIDEPFLNPFENNFLLSITASQAEQGFNTPVGLAWIDVSTGEFYTKHGALSTLRDDLVRINPKEVVLDQRLSKDDSSAIRQLLSEEGSFVSYAAMPHEPPIEDALLSDGDALNPDDVTAQSDASCTLPTRSSVDETEAIQLLVSFMHTHLMEHMPSLISPSPESTTGRMLIDSHTVKALEIRENLGDGGMTGSLLSVIKRTVTSSGTRLLARWLCSPSTSVAEINARQSLVAFFHSRAFLRQDILQHLRETEDASRIIQKLLLGRGCFNDLTSICICIDTWERIKQRIITEKWDSEERSESPEWTNMEALLNKLEDLNALADRIRTSVIPRDWTATEGEQSELPDPAASPPAGARDPMNPLGLVEWTVKPEFSEELITLHEKLRSLLNTKDSLERRLQIQFLAPSLKLRASPGAGMFVHLSRKKDAARLKGSPEFAPLSESSSTCTFFHSAWSRLGTEISQTAVSISMAEKRAFEDLRLEVIAQSGKLRRNAKIVDELDVTLAFASLATEMRWVRPVVKEGTAYNVVNGRHPTVELGLLKAGRTFVPNAVSFTQDAQLHLITGPNMAGKSTLLRQTALMSILAQTGSFVPADHAELGIVDRVFSRVGAKDDLFRDRSTFMVEMLETSDILHRATPNSLVIMDEVGRGTTTNDGLAIAFSAINHLLTVNCCRAMFATHFHELADMLGHNPETHRGRGPFSKVAFYYTDITETGDGYFTYTHRLSSGVNRDSHGLMVAKLAGMPQPMIEVAQSALAWLKQRSAERVGDRQALQDLGQTLATNRIMTLET